MPYKRTNKKRTYRRKKRPTAASVSKRLNRLQKAIEYKHADQAISASVSSSGYFQNLTQIPQGSSDITRDGDKLTVTSVSFRMELYSGDSPYNHLRLVLFRWNNLYQTPTLNDLFLIGPSTVATYNYMWNVDTIRARPGFKVLYDRTISNKVSNDGSSKLNTLIRKKIPFRTNLQFQAGGLVGSSLYLFAISDSGIATHPVLSGMVRTNYFDL